MFKAFFAVLTFSGLIAHAATPVFGSVFMALGADTDSKNYFSNIAKVTQQISLSGIRKDSTETLNALRFYSALVQDDAVKYVFHQGEAIGETYCGLDVQFKVTGNKEAISNVTAKYACHDISN